MSKQIYKQQNDLAKLIERFSVQDSVLETAIPSLFLIHKPNITVPTYGVQKPSLCIVVQGAKEVLLAQERFLYGPGDYLVASVDLPVTGQVIEASTNDPYLCFKLEFTPNQILEVLSDSKIDIVPKENVKRAMFVSSIELPILEAVIRLIRLLENPEDIPVLAPLFTKEIIYRVLQGQHGATLEQMAIEGSYTYRIRDVIKQIKNNYDRSIRIEELAEIANMSVSSLHRHFKEVTAMSPIQFQKHFRLREARRLLLSESTDATDVAFRVGYESPSQFSREYSRMFGLPPREDIKRLREKYDQSINA
ncbi:AraC family transcriptional regulator [Lederbergia lenta]|uniref:Transcriptional Regulator N/C terminus, AraC family protein n=1 Tax=Lederbergia lenta TaxID=1467 RepID=A0A2X4W6N7_LEDLE|nr:AraC family transcriptional regulator [Lederbergia lenta]MEC2324675.1 AraC family transcriptional regulator [Lederbergia lenta]SQI58673.1 transcriptional Regulator N/C terminus, AraC family protein [Lederbergia lenta]